MKLRDLITGLSLLMLLSCSKHDEKIPFVDYEFEMDSLEFKYASHVEGERPVDLCNIFNKSSWDSIIVIVPYLPLSKLDELNICNVNEIRDTLEYVVDVEWNFGLLFLEKNCVTSYTVVGGNPSFVYLEGWTRKLIPILKRSDCLVKFRNIQSDKGEQSFYFVPFELSNEDARFEEQLNRDQTSSDSVQ